MAIKCKATEKLLVAFQWGPIMCWNWNKSSIKCIETSFWRNRTPFRKCHRYVLNPSNLAVWMRESTKKLSVAWSFEPRDRWNCYCDMIIDSLWRYFDREEIWKKKWMLISQAFQSFGCWCCSVNIRQTLKNIHIFTASLILCSNAFWSLFVVYFHSLHRSFWYRALLFLRFHSKFASLSHSISLSIHNFIRCKKTGNCFVFYVKIGGQ